MLTITVEILPASSGGRDEKRKKKEIETIVVKPKSADKYVENGECLVITMDVQAVQLVPYIQA